MEKQSSVIIYTRVSGIGLNGLAEKQVELCKKYCRENNLRSPVVESVKGSSGKTFKYLVQRVKDSDIKVDLVVSSVDRITRIQSGWQDILKLVNKGKLKVHTPMKLDTKSYLDLQKIFAEHHSKKLSDRAKQSWKLRKERLAKLKAPAGTSASNDDISQYL